MHHPNNVHKIEIQCAAILFCAFCTLYILRVGSIPRSLTSCLRQDHKAPCSEPTRKAHSTCDEHRTSQFGPMEKDQVFCLESLWKRGISRSSTDCVVVIVCTIFFSFWLTRFFPVFDLYCPRPLGLRPKAASDGSNRLRQSWKNVELQYKTKYS